MTYKFCYIRSKLHPKVESYFTDWWLVVDNQERLIDFLKLRAERTASQYMNMKSRILSNCHLRDGEQEVMLMMLESTNRKESATLVDDLSILNEKMSESYIRVFTDYGKIKISKNLIGFNALDSHDDIILETRELEECKFPSYSEDDIIVSKWPNGKHFYAKIGPIDVKDADGNLKWDTWEEAKKVAVRFFNAEFNKKVS